MATGSFVAADTATQGTWLGVYGSLGYSKMEGSGLTLVESLPGGWSAIARTGFNTFSFSNTTSNVKHLQRVDGTTRDADGWYNGGTPAKFNIAPNNATEYLVRIYLLDPDSTARSASISLCDTSNDAVLATATTATYGLSGNYSAGLWLTFKFTGSVYLKQTLVAGANAVALGLFFDPSTTVVVPSRSALLGVG